MEKGYIQVYTGNGKGKTTAALGLALRALCAGKKVFMLQFLKGMPYSELKAQELLEGLTIEQHGGQCFVGKDPSPEDYRLAEQGLGRLEEVLSSRAHDVVIADELNVALSLGLLKTEDVLPVLKRRGEGTELVITGRYAPGEIIDLADLVTVMTEVKHYYHRGVEARTGIEK